MRLIVLTSFVYFSFLSVASGQPSPSVTGNYVSTLSHLKGVGVSVRYHGLNDRRRIIQSTFEEQVNSRILESSDIKIYTSKDKKRFESLEPSRPILNVIVDTQRLPRAEYSVDIVVTQDATIKGTSEEIRVDTYTVYGDISRGRYFTENIDPVARAQRAVNMMVRQFIEDFRRSKSD